MEYSKKLQIFVCTHKSSFYTRDGGVYRALQCGAAINPEVNPEYLRDDTGNNISERNSYWSEWSGIYWIWKNVKDVEYIGINHYRRYFDIDVNEDNIESLLDGYDMIVAKGKRMKHKYDRFPNLCKHTSPAEAKVFIQTLLEFHPEIRTELLLHFYNSRESIPNSMLIAKKKVFDEYCDFVFPILFETERRIKKYNLHRPLRDVGYFGEWMLGIYLFVMSKTVRYERVDFLQERKSRLCGIKVWLEDLKYYLISKFDRCSTPSEFVWL